MNRTSINIFLILAWSSLDLDRVHFTPKQESRTSNNNINNSSISSNSKLRKKEKKTKKIQWNFFFI